MNSLLQRTLVSLAGLMIIGGHLNAQLAELDDSPGHRLYKQKLSPCVYPGVTDTVYCGKLEVFENRTERNRKISIAVTLIPAASKDLILSPIFDFQGGPGAPGFPGVWFYPNTPFHKNRDIILMDMRGTGNSNPLHCPALQVKTEVAQLVEEMYPPQKVADCFADLSKKNDMTQYTTEVAVQDAEEIRLWLGYNQINLLGTSYGTRLCQSYMSQFGRSIRSVVMIGACPSFISTPLYHAYDAETAWKKIAMDCMDDSACNNFYGNVRDTLTVLLTRLERNPIRYFYSDKSKGWADSVTITRDFVAETLRTSMYSTHYQRTLTLNLIRQATLGNFDPIINVVARRSAIPEALAEGLYLCSTCSEDVPFISPKASTKNTKLTFLGSYRIDQQMRACRYWTSVPVKNTIRKPVKSDVPVLIVSGTHDPITPPRWGEAMMEKFSNGSHIIIRGMGHGFFGMINTDCLLNGLSGFFHDPDNGVVMECIETMKPIPFTLH